MSKICITVEAESLNQAIAMLSLKNIAPAAESAKASVKEAKGPAKAATKAPAIEEPEAQEAAETVVTLEEVRAKLAIFTRAGRQAEVKKLLGDFGAAKLTEVPAEKYPELLKEAEAIA